MKCDFYFGHAKEDNGIVFIDKDEIDAVTDFCEESKCCAVPLEKDQQVYNDFLKTLDLFCFRFGYTIFEGRDQIFVEDSNTVNKIFSDIGELDCDRLSFSFGKGDENFLDVRAFDSHTYGGCKPLARSSMKISPIQRYQIEGTVWQKI